MLPCYRFIRKSHGLPFFLKSSVFCSSDIHAPSKARVWRSLENFGRKHGNGLGGCAARFTPTVLHCAWDCVPTNSLLMGPMWVLLGSWVILLCVVSCIVLCFQLTAVSKGYVHLFNSLWCSCFSAILSAWQWITGRNGCYFLPLCCLAGLHLWWCGIL